MYDVVDFQDEVIGQATRERIHAEGLRHRAVHVLVRDEKGQVWLQRRSRYKRQHPLCWDSTCSGHVDAGESYLMAAEREFEEELGVKARGLRAIFKLDACEETGWEFVWVYEVRWLGGGDFKPNEEEIEALGVFSFDEVEGLMKREAVAPAFRYLWPFYRLRVEQQQMRPLMQRWVV